MKRIPFWNVLHLEESTTFWSKSQRKWSNLRNLVFSLRILSSLRWRQMLAGTAGGAGKHWETRYEQLYFRIVVEGFLKLRAGEFGYSDLKPEVLKEIQDRSWVEKRIEGTNFCSRRIPQHSYIPEHLGEKIQLDQCCMSLWSCEDPIQPLWYDHSLLNSSHFPLFSCSCFKKFLECLKDLEDNEEASRLRSAWGKYGGECYNLQAKTR